MTIPPFWNPRIPIKSTNLSTSALKFISWNAGHLEGAEQAPGAANDDPRGRPMCMCVYPLVN